MRLGTQSLSAIPIKQDSIYTIKTQHTADLSCSNRSVHTSFSFFSVKWMRWDNRYQSWHKPTWGDGMFWQPKVSRKAWLGRFTKTHTTEKKTSSLALSLCHLLLLLFFSNFKSTPLCSTRPLEDILKLISQHFQLFMTLFSLPPKKAAVSCFCWYQMPRFLNKSWPLLWFPWGLSRMSEIRWLSSWQGTSAAIKMMLFFVYVCAVL